MSVLAVVWSLGDRYFSSGDSFSDSLLFPETWPKQVKSFFGFFRIGFRRILSCPLWSLSPCSRKPSASSSWVEPIFPSTRVKSVVANGCSLGLWAMPFLLDNRNTSLKARNLTRRLALVGVFFWDSIVSWSPFCDSFEVCLPLGMASHLRLISVRSGLFLPLVRKRFCSNGPRSFTVTLLSHFNSLLSVLRFALFLATVVLGFFPPQAAPRMMSGSQTNKNPLLHSPLTDTVSSLSTTPLTLCCVIGIVTFESGHLSMASNLFGLQEPHNKKLSLAAKTSTKALLPLRCRHRLSPKIHRERS